MRYFKIYTDDTFIGITTSANFLTYQAKNNLLIITDDEIGQFVGYKGTLYRDSWMAPLPAREYTYVSAIVRAIEKEEYDILAASIENNETIPVPQPVIPEPIDIEVPDITLEFVITSKIKEMKYVCQQAIYAGFDIEWEDHTTSHFSMTEQDQLNLMELSTMIASGMPSLPYHADGEAAKFYTVEEAQKIINASTKHKMYHTSYFNCLKPYIQSLETIEAVAAVTYGDTIPAQFETDVYKMVK